MVPGVEMNFELHFNSPDFYTFSTLTSGTGRKRYVTLREQDVDITLHLCRLSLNPDVYSTLEGERKLRKEVVKYPVVRDQIRTFTFNGATTVWMQDNLFLNRVPQRMIVGILDSTAFNGDKEKYPFAFQSKGVTTVRQFIEGEEYPYVTLELTGNTALNVRLEIKFRAALNANITILVWGEFESVIYIDHLGAVTYDNRV